MLMIIISRSSSKLGHGGSKTRSLGQILEKKTLCTLKDTVLIQSSWNFVRLLIIIISWSGLKLGHVRSKTRSVCQILEKPSIPSRGQSFDLKFIHLCQKVNHYNI